MSLQGLLTLYQNSQAMSLLSAQKPETFLLSQEQQDKLPVEAREALEQVDQRASAALNPFLTR